jgi:multidrug resistance efflux pump
LIAKGDVSQRTFDEGKATYDVNQARLAQAQSQRIQADAALHQSQAELAQAKASLGAPGDENAQLRAAKAALATAQLSLDFTQVKAPADGYVTNLNLRLGSQVVANQPALALVDVNSFWVHGFFRETMVGELRAGDRAIVTLMTYPDRPLEGYVDSIGWGIAQQDGSTGPDLLPAINPTFEWIRLAQRVPVRVHLDLVPEGVELRVGTTASVLVRAGTAANDAKRPPTAVPKLLQ